jgi:transposase
MPARHPQRPHHRRGVDGRQSAGPVHGIPRASKQDLTAQLDVLVQQINPALRAAYGVGPDTAAQLLVTAGINPHRLRNAASFAALCEVAPVPASSGKITRHRLSRGGDRAANNALLPHRAGAHVGPPADPRLRPASTRQRPHQKRDSAVTQTSHRPRNIQTADPTRPNRTTTATCGLPDKQARNITLPTVATHFGVPLITVSRLERGHQRNDTLANNYRQWLTAA